MVKGNISTYNNKLKSSFINYFVIIFLIHGFLFFIMPNEINDNNSPIRNIKYILLVIILITILFNCKVKKIFFYLMISIALLISNLISVGSYFSLRSFLVYIIPLIIFFVHHELSKYLNIGKIVSVVYVFSSILSYIEFFVYNGIFFKFSSSGYWVISIFVNPNNFGIVITLLTIYLIERKLSLNKFYKVCLLLNSFLLIFLSGSKTALVSLLLVMFYYFVTLLKHFIFNNNIKIKLKMLFILTISVILFLLFVTMFYNNIFYVYNDILATTRSFETINISAMTRYNEYHAFIINCDNLIFPWRAKINYIDNIYLHIWGTYGLFIFILFIMFNEYVLFYAVYKKRKLQTLLLIILLLSGLTTNILYIWPISYFYWYLSADIFNNKNKFIRLKEEINGQCKL